MTAQQPYTLLVVDDEPNIVSAIRRLFHGDRMRLRTAASGEEALTIVRESTVHVLLTDNRMPGMSGVELLRRVRAVSPDTIRMIISGQSDMDALVEAINDGEVFRFIMKPWNDIDLKIAVNLAMAHRSLQDDNKQLERRVEQLERVVEVVKDAYPEIYQQIAADVACRTGVLQ